MSGSNALQITDPDADSDNPLTRGAPSWADAYRTLDPSGVVSGQVDKLGQWLAEQRAKSAKMGLWDEQRGIPTGAGLVNAAQQTGNALLMGTTAPGARPGFSLEQVHPRTLKPLTSEADVSQAGSHAYSIKDPDGNSVGLVDTNWNPDTGGLHIADFQSNQGANSLGPAAIRQIRDLLVARYPGVRTLSGQRITGAISADRASGAGPGRAATQTVGDQ